MKRKGGVRKMEILKEFLGGVVIAALMIGFPIFMFLL